MLQFDSPHNLFLTIPDRLHPIPDLFTRPLQMFSSEVRILARRHLRALLYVAIPAPFHPGLSNRTISPALDLNFNCFSNLFLKLHLQISSLSRIAYDYKIFRVRFKKALVEKIVDSVLNHVGLHKRYGNTQRDLTVSVAFQRV